MDAFELQRLSKLLLSKIETIKTAAFETFHDKTDRSNGISTYKQTYLEAQAIIELFRNDAIEILNPNPYSHLEDWMNVYRSTLLEYAHMSSDYQAKTQVYLRNLYDPIALPIQTALTKIELTQSVEYLGDDLRRSFPPIGSFIGQPDIRITVSVDELHPAVAEKSAKLFKDGHHGDAVLAAMKVVEVYLRERCGLDESLYGTDLVSAAMNCKKPLLKFGYGASEQEGAHALFRGAVGWFRNPLAHKFIVIDSPVEALEILAFASLLLRMIDSVSKEDPLQSQAEEFFKAIAGKWKLEFEFKGAWRSEEARIDTEGNYYCTKNGGPEQHIFRLTQVKFDKAASTVQFSKVEVTGPKMGYVRSIEILTLDPAAKSMTGHAQHDGHGLRYMR